MNKNAALFLSGKGDLTFPELLDKVQNYMSENYKELLNGTGKDKSELLISEIRRFLTENRLGVDGMSQDETIKKLYREMSEYSFLTPYLNFEVKNVEGIEICSPESIWIKYAGGKEIRSEEHFFSASHAKNVMARLLHKSGIAMDNTRPLVRGHLGKNIRITVNGGGGTLDDDVGVTASIRFVNPNNLTRDDLIENGTLTPEMMDFLICAYRYGCSTMLAGETDAGKTTLISIIMYESVPNDKKLYTIEYGTREFNLEKRDEDGRICNKVVHTITRESDDPKLVITPQMLIEHGMTMNPDYICMAEVKGSEAFETIEAAETGHPVIGTVHADSVEDIPNRLVPLASMKSSSLSEKTLYYLVSKAFPILIYARKMEDGKRRVTDICECKPKNNLPEITPLWKYNVDYNETISGNTVIHGKFVKCGVISENLQRHLRGKGMPENMIQKFVKG